VHAVAGLLLDVEERAVDQRRVESKSRASISIEDWWNFSLSSM
jgi:hypothetical protein